MDFIKCITYPQIKIGRYIKSGNSFDKRIFLLEIIGRPTVVTAATATLIMGKILDCEFSYDNDSLNSVSKYNEDRLSVNKQTTPDGLTVATIINQSIKDLFSLSDGRPDKKFIEVLRTKTSIPVADEWASELYETLNKKRLIMAIASNIGEFGTISNNEKERVDEAINDFISGIKYNNNLPDIDVPKNIGAFVDAFSKPLSDMIYKKCKVIYDGKPEDKIDYSLITNNGFIPYPQQADIANAIVKRLETENSVFIGAEMGCGKTLMSIMALYGLYKKTGKGVRALLMVPPHLVEKWIREAKKALGDTVLQSVTVINNKADADEIRSLIGVKPKGVEVYIVSREMAKLGYYWRPVNVKFIDEKTGKMIVKCPKCGSEQVVNKNAKSYCKNKLSRLHGITATEDGDVKAEHIADEKQAYDEICGEPLWQATESEGSGKQIQRVPIMEYLKKYLPGGFFDLFILDEAHEEKGESARGVAAAQAACVSKKALLLTGTLSGGKPSTLFYLLWRFNAKSVKDISVYGDTIGFAKKYGVVETVRKSDTGVDNSMSRSKKQNVVLKEKPGISPELLTKFLPMTAFMKISDVAAGLPEYTEYVTQVELNEKHMTEYSRINAEMFNAFEKAIRMGALGVLAKMLTVLSAYADNPVYEEVTDKKGGLVTVCTELDGVTAKEEKLVEIINENKAQGRKTLVYCEYTDRRDIQQRLKNTLAGYDITAVVLPSSIKPVKREEWIRDNTADTDVLISNPRLVATGLDLYQYPTIVFFQTPYSTYLLRQASRRSWRIGQTEPVEVHFLVNSYTVQEKAMLLIANKMTASQIFEGEIPEEDGLAALSDIEEKSFIRELAESLSKNENTGSLDKLWKQKMQASVKADDLLFAPQAVIEKPIKTATVAETEKSAIKSNRGFSEKFVFTKISSVNIHPDKAASFMLDGKMYLMKNGNIYRVSGKPNDMNKSYAGKYAWKDSKKTGNKFAECRINNGNIIYVGKKADTGEYVALKIMKAKVAA